MGAYAVFQGLSIVFVCGVASIALAVVTFRNWS